LNILLFYWLERDMVVSASTNSNPKYSQRPMRLKNSLKRRPTYQTMISDALVELERTNRNGSSATAIAKSIEAKYLVVPSFRARLGHVIKRGVEDGWLIQIRRSYKLSKEEKRRLKKQAKEQQEPLGEPNSPLDPPREDFNDDAATESEVEYRTRLRRRVKRRLKFD